MHNSLSAYVSEVGKVVLIEEIVGEPKGNELLLKSIYSTMSPGTEYSLMANHILPLPQRLGYSFVAEVIAVGDLVTEYKVGDKVAGTGQHAQYMTLDERTVVKVPANTNLEQAAFFNLAHTALYAIRQSRLQLGESCMVIGQGIVGLLTAQLAKVAGAVPVIVTDIDDDRLKKSKEIGIDYASNTGENTDQLQALMSDLGVESGVSVVFEATGAREPINMAFDLVAERGRVVMMSQASDEGSFAFSWPLMLKGASLIGAYINSKPFSLRRSDIEITDQWPPSISQGQPRYQNADMWTSYDDIRVIFNLMDNNMLDLEPIITHRFNYKDTPEAYELVWNKDSQLIGGVIDWT
jgi:2-desacetyl-2-hydroxyethyl bacteriochlorophyllide A dehydrogenase